VLRDGLPRFAADREIGERAADKWAEIEVPLGDVAGGDEVEIASVVGAFRDFHVWLLRAR
jgi:hypothetical protein